MNIRTALQGATALAACAAAFAGLQAGSQTPQEQAEAAPQAVWNQADLEALSARVQADVEALRGAKFSGPVPVKVADKASLLEYIQRRSDETDPPEKVAADETIAKLLGAMDPSLDLMATTLELLADQVGGFYDPPSKTFYLMDSMPKGFGAPILAHELVHALDDQLFDLDSVLKEVSDDSDALQAYRFVVEGSGTAYGNRWSLEHINEFDLSGYSELMDAQQASLAKAPAWLWKPLLGAYMQGSAFLVRSDKALDGSTKKVSRADLERAFRERPRSTEQVLHPEKYWDPALRDEPRPVRYELSKLPSGWRELRQDTLGELGLALVASAASEASLDLSNPVAVLGVAYTNTAAQGWDGDRVVLLGRWGERWLRCVSVWDSERDAAEFLGAMSTRVDALRSAARAIAGSDAKARNSNVELAYGERADEVVLTVWSNVDRWTLEDLSKAVHHAVGPNPPE